MQVDQEMLFEIILVCVAQSVLANHLSNSILRPPIILTLSPSLTLVARLSQTWLKESHRRRSEKPSILRMTSLLRRKIKSAERMSGPRIAERCFLTIIRPRPFRLLALPSLCATALLCLQNWKETSTFNNISLLIVLPTGYNIPREWSNDVIAWILFAIPFSFYGWVWGVTLKGVRCILGEATTWSSYLPALDSILLLSDS